LLGNSGQASLSNPDENATAAEDDIIQQPEAENPDWYEGDISYLISQSEELDDIIISKNNTLSSVRSVRLTHLTLERKSRTRTPLPYYTTHLTQPDAAPNPQDAPDAAPNPQDAT